MKISKFEILLMIFGLLDAVAFIRALPLIVRFCHGLAQVGDQSPTRIVVLTVIQLVLYASYPVSAYAFIRRRNWAFPLYYCQFPLRLGYFSTSLGFLFLINEALQSTLVHYVIAGLALLGEVIRLAVTVVIRKRTNKALQSNLALRGGPYQAAKG